MKKIYLLVLLQVVFASTAFGQQLKTFSTLGEWGGASNWNPTGVPNGTNDAFIRRSATVSSLYYIANVEVDNGESITITPTGNLIIGTQTAFNSTVTKTVQLAVGTTNWLAPSGITGTSTIRAWGGGGAGGAAASTGTTPSVGGGGAGGVYAVRALTLVEGVNHAVVVGAGGGAGTSPSAGTASIFRNSLGTIILNAPGGAAGGNGIDGTINSGNRRGAGGLGSATGAVGDSFTAGSNGLRSNDTNASGAGGQGATTAGGAGGASQALNNTAGFLGAAPGGGGSGGKRSTNVATVIGGDGGSGGMSITYTVSDRKNLTFMNNNQLVVQSGGRLEIWGDLIINNGINMTLDGTMIVHGNVRMLNNGAVTVGGSGSLSVGGNFAANNNITMLNDGNIAIAGTLTVGNGSVYSGKGRITYNGCTSGSGGFCQQIVIIVQPIDLLYFRAIAGNASINTEWASSKEWNFSHYTVERSGNGRDFTPVHTVYGEGDSFNTKKYSFTDNQPLYGANYYRLIATDIDGSVEEKGMVVAYYGIKGDLQLWPNPSSRNAEVKISNPGGIAGTWLSIYNTSGQELLRIPADEKELYLPVSNLAKGLYLIKVWNHLEIKQTKLMVK